MAKQMTPAQRRKANALIRKTCCNYDNGNCIALDDGLSGPPQSLSALWGEDELQNERALPFGKARDMEHVRTSVCVQSISYSLICKWFLNAVLPADKALCAEIMGETVKRCAVCGAGFTPRSNRAKYCENCAHKVHRRQKNESNRRKRSLSDN